MRRNATYWVGNKPSGASKWIYTESGEVIDDPQVLQAVFHMQRRYAKQWNDIELDRSRSLAEHTHKVHGAQVVGGNRKFILHAEDKDHPWILELLYARGFSEFHPGWSFGKNPFRSVDDIRSARIHWKGDGRLRFERWLVEEREANEANGEATEYNNKKIRR